MKKINRFWIYPLWILSVFSMLTNGCKKDDNSSPAVQIPILTSSAITDITEASAICGGNISSDGGATIIVRGVCWSTGPTPSISDSKTSDGMNSGSFLSNLTGLTANTTYYVRAYATNSAGTGYGNIVSFKTINVTLSLSQKVAGNYSGNGKYMPADQSLGPNTYECTVPDWESFLQSGPATAIVSSINDTTVHIVLSGGIYSNSFNKNLILSGNGNEISDENGIVAFFIDTNSLQISFSNIVWVGGSECVPVNKYYRVFDGIITYPPTPNHIYTSIETWEFNGNK